MSVEEGREEEVVEEGTISDGNHARGPLEENAAQSHSESSHDDTQGQRLIDMNDNNVPVNDSEALAMNLADVRLKIDDEEDAASVTETEASIGVDGDDVHSSMTVTGATASHLKRELTSALEGKRTIRRLSISHAADCEQVRFIYSCEYLSLK